MRQSLLALFFSCSLGPGFPGFFILPESFSLHFYEYFYLPFYIQKNILFSKEKLTNEHNLFHGDRMETLQEIAENLVRAKVLLESSSSSAETDEAWNLMDSASHALCAMLGMDEASLARLFRRSMP